MMPLIYLCNIKVLNYIENKLMLFSSIIHPVQCGMSVSITDKPITALPVHKSGQDGNCWTGWIMLNS